MLRTALAQAVKWGWLVTNRPPPRHHPSRRESRTTPIPSADDVAQLVKTAHDGNPMLAVFLRLAAATGARRGELCGLRWDDVDLDQGSLTTRRSIANTRTMGVVEKDTKTHAERRLSLDAGTVAVLAEHRRTVAEFVER